MSSTSRSYKNSYYYSRSNTDVFYRTVYNGNTDAWEEFIYVYSKSDFPGFRVSTYSFTLTARNLISSEYTSIINGDRRTLTKTYNYSLKTFYVRNLTNLSVSFYYDSRPSTTSDIFTDMTYHTEKYGFGDYTAGKIITKYRPVFSRTSSTNPAKGLKATYVTSFLQDYYFFFYHAKQDQWKYSYYTSYFTKSVGVVATYVTSTIYKW